MAEEKLEMKNTASGAKSILCIKKQRSKVAE